MRQTAKYTILALFVFLLDRITKFGAMQYCMDRCYINRFLSFEVGFNRGITWGMFYSQSTMQFICITLLIFAITCALIWYAWDRAKEGHSIFGELLVISGSLSNILDRIIFGGVVDFIEFSYKGYIWPSFNIADSCIVLGVGIMLIEQLKGERK